MTIKINASYDIEDKYFFTYLIFFLSYTSVFCTHLTIRIVYYIENDHFPSNEEIEQEGVFAI